MAAIYMWFDGTIVYTTTLYPVDATDAIDFGGTLASGSMQEPPNDDAQYSEGVPLNGTYIQLRWFYSYGPESDDAQYSEGVPLDGTYIQLRWFYSYGPESDQAQWVEGVPLDGTYISKRVWADSPDEKIDFSCAPTTSCSMDAV